MNHQFQIGDTVKIRRTGLEVEIVEIHPKHKSHVLVAWFDDTEFYQEVYVAVEELDLVKSAKKEAVDS